MDVGVAAMSVMVIENGGQHGGYSDFMKKTTFYSAK